MTAVAPRPPLLRLRRAAFWLYAAVLVVATHLPEVRIESDLVKRPDLLIHVSAFGLWTALLIASAYLGPPVKSRTALRAFAVGVAFAAMDEASQAIPFFRRTAGFDDFLANTLGVAAACGAAALAARFAPPRTRAFINGEPPPAPANPV